MRPIKFKGKAVWSIDKLNELNIDHVNGWVYGNLVIYDDIPFIVALSLVADVYDYWIKVHPESVGQYTGLKDQNGRDIYERDVVKFHFPNPYITVVKFENGHFSFYKDKRMMVDPHYYMNRAWSYAEVIGNVYENPELLKESEE